MTNTANTTILVIGSTGKTGSRVVDQLETRGIRVRLGSRSADITFDRDHPQTWVADYAREAAVCLNLAERISVPRRDPLNPRGIGTARRRGVAAPPTHVHASA
jgi:uncharacterized protein YbjT (DUF2867 family)